jgi:hypothetical protein
MLGRRWVDAEDLPGAPSHRLHCTSLEKLVAKRRSCALGFLGRLGWRSHDIRTSHERVGLIEALELMLRIGVGWGFLEDALNEVPVSVDYKFLGCARGQPKRAISSSKATLRGCLVVRWTH